MIDLSEETHLGVMQARDRLFAEKAPTTHILGFLEPGVSHSKSQVFTEYSSKFRAVNRNLKETIEKYTCSRVDQVCAFEAEEQALLFAVRRVYAAVMM